MILYEIFHELMQAQYMKNMNNHLIQLIFCQLIISSKKQISLKELFSEEKDLEKVIIIQWMYILDIKLKKNSEEEDNGKG